MNRIPLALIPLSIFLLPAEIVRADFTARVIVEVEPTGSFDVFVDVSAEDNFGLASYAIPLIGDILTINHKSPNGRVQDSLGVEGNVGFSFFRSPDNSPFLFASQDTISPSPFLVAGFGQVAGSLSDFGTLFGAEQPTYDARLLIASGTWDTPGARPRVDYGSVELGGNLFFTESLSRTRSAMFQTPVGDFDLNGVIDALDIDLLCQNQGGNDPQFDLNSDNLINQQDVDHLVQDVLGSKYGDSNLDGTFGTGDLILVFQAGQYEDGVLKNSGWASGDWTCDMEFDSSDLISVFQKGTFSAAAVAVPEPTNLPVIACAILLSLHRISRRRQSNRRRHA